MSDRNAPELTRPRAPWLSAVAIMRNEETNLPGLFATLRGRVGELILVDDSSTDRSLELAAAEGAWVRVIAHSMTPDGGFAGQRNIGLDAARGSWALHMDCDERLSPELFEELCRVLPETPHNGMRYRRINYFLHRPMGHGGWNTWNRPQIARIGHHRFEGRLHETCVIEGAAAMTGQLQHPMHHLNDVDLTQRLRKSEKYVGMDAERLAESRRRVRGSELVWRPLIEFAKKYVWRRGFLDGTPGLIAALHSATAVFRTHALVWDQQNRIERGEIEAALEPRKGQR